MSKVNHRIRRTSTGVYPQHSLILAALAIAVPAMTVAALRGAELVDSGWAVATPSPLAAGQSHDVHQQIILRNVLEGTQQPLLKKPAASSAANATKSDNLVADRRVAVRPDGVDGWRPAPSATVPPASALPSVPTTNAPVPMLVVPQGSASGNSARAVEAPTGSTPRFEGPSFGAPTAEGTPLQELERTAETDHDCSGQPVAATGGQASPPVAAEPALADAYGSFAEAAETTEPKAAPAGSDHTNVPAAAPTAEPVSAASESASAATSENSNAAGSNNEPAISGAATESNANPDAAGDTSRSADASSPSSSSSRSPTATKPAITAPAEVVPPPPLTRQLLTLRTRVRSVLKGYYRKHLNTTDNDPWEVMHGMLAYGVNSRVRQGGSNGAPITSVGWLCFNKPCKGQAMLYVNPEGELRAKYGVGLQGHLGQLLAMLAQCRVSAEYPIQVGKDKFTIRDLIEAEKKTCYPKSELTFKLLALQYYIDLNDKWMNDQGLEWDFPRLLREEMAQPVRTAACGGTHRLSALSLTVKTRIRRGEPLDGEYAEAADFVKKYHQYAFRLQNKDGSLSTQWFKGPGDEDDDDRRIKTTGHILEWLCYSLSDEELRDQRTIRAVSYLTNLMYSNYEHEWEIGPRSHALHALLLYDERVFQPFDKEGAIAFYLPQANTAKNNQSNGKRR